MEFIEFYKTMDRNKYYIFSLKDIKSFCPNEKNDNLKKLLYRWKKRELITQLKKGLYELSYPNDFNIPDLYIANKLYSPSYVSLEAALSNYSIIPEVSIAVTSISTKPTRRFRNKHGLFIYRSVKPEIFTGYYVEKYGNFNIFIAEPEKAFIDYIYFKSLRNKKFNLKDERFDRDLVSKLNRKKLDKYAKIAKLNLREIYAYL